MTKFALRLRAFLAAAAALPACGSAWVFAPGAQTRRATVSSRSSASTFRRHPTHQHLSESGSAAAAEADAAVSSFPPSSSTVVNNVVLLPSYDDPEMFDSHSIGTSRVHKYVRDFGGGGESEYVLWYHGRCIGLNDPENALPPLSTGRIGRATSRDGLKWTKCPLGSGSEIGTGVSLGFNTEDWWKFDTAHVGLGQVMLPMSTPAVLCEGGVYLLYYMGGTHEETFVGSYLEDPTVIPDDATIRGMNLRIGVAMSQDGLTWGRVEGDDPTGAVVCPFDRSDPNQKWMTSEMGYRDDDSSPLVLEEELYCGWPEVVVHHTGDGAGNALSVNSFGNAVSSGSNGKKKPPAFYMYYSTMLKECKTKVIGCAVSEDGFRWLKRGTCLRPSSSSSEDDDEDEEGEEPMDAAGCARCTVIRNQVFDSDTKLWEDSDGWTMYYEGVSRRDGKHRVMAAESPNGRDWTKLGVVLDVGDEDMEGAWDFDGVGSPHILRLDDGTVRMYYTGQGRDGHTAIGVARAADGNGGPTAKFVREHAEI